LTLLNRPKTILNSVQVFVPRTLADEEDVLQNVYNILYKRLKQGEYDLANRDDLWKLLVTITLHKTRNVANYHRRKQRDVVRDQTMSGGDETDSARWALEQMEATEPSPAEAAILNETLERWLEALADPDLVQIALLRLEGYTNREIAERRGCVERTIERKLALIRDTITSFNDSAS
jgi:RNA polymerase sigma factor (sigma-70 family)